MMGMLDHWVRDLEDTGMVEVEEEKMMGMLDHWVRDLEDTGILEEEE